MSEFHSKHIGPTSKEVTEMLSSLGCNSLDELLEKIVPKNILDIDGESIGNENFTENDILNHCTNSKGFEKKVSECMQKNYVSLQINSSLEDLIALLKENNIAIILKEEKFVGIITRIDLLAYLKRN